MWNNIKKCLVVVCILLGLSSYTYCEYEFEYTIQYGDTLWTIAIYELKIDPLDFSKFVEEVKQANPWIKDDNLIYRGSKLRLPEPVDIKYDTSERIKTEATLNTPETFVTKSEKYVIQYGDSLWSILSNRYNLKDNHNLEVIKQMGKLVTLCLKMNPSIRNPDILWVGKVILIPENVGFLKIDKIAVSGVVENNSLQNIISEAQNKSPEEVDELFSKVPDYQLVKNSLIVISFGRYELKMNADRLLVSQDVTDGNKQEYLVNYLLSNSERTSLHLKNLLKEKSYVLVEIIVK